MRKTLLAAVGVLAIAVALPALAGIEPIKRVNPVFPPDAQRAGKSGYVDVEFTVDPTGKVASVSVVDAKPAHTFEAAAVKAVKQWQFAPGSDARGKVRIDFAN